MFQNLPFFQTAISLARHSSARQSLIAGNIANADTPGFRARDLAPFTAAAPNGPTNFRPNASRDGHLGRPLIANEQMAILVEETLSANGNGVSLEEELLKSVEAKRAHDQALAIYRSGLTILRTSLGKT